MAKEADSTLRYKKLRLTFGIQVPHLCKIEEFLENFVELRENSARHPRRLSPYEMYLRQEKRVFKRLFSFSCSVRRAMLI